MKISLITVATGKYLEYWMDLASSVSKHCGDDIEISYHIFTDRIKEVKNFGHTLDNILVIAHEIDSQNWLNGTLKRYSHYRKHFDSITGEIVLHLDADMLVVDSFLEEILDSIRHNMDLVNLVYHPGFWRKNKFYFPYLFNKLTYRNEINNLLKSVFRKRLGSWETRLESTAYTHKDLRKAYYCGAVWFGKRDIIYRFVTEVDSLISRDQKKGIIARWHDESYLNSWAANNLHNSNSPKYCYLLGRAHLSKIKPLIVAIDKVTTS